MLLPVATKPFSIPLTTLAPHGPGSDGANTKSHLMSFASRLFLGALAVCTSLSSTVYSQPRVVQVPFQAVPDFLGFVEDEFIVVFDAPTRTILRVESNHGNSPVVNIPDIQGILNTHAVINFRRQFATAVQQPFGSPRPDLTGHYKVQVSSGTRLEAALAAFRAHPGALKVEKIGIHAVSLTPNDPYYMGSPNPNFDFDQWHYWDTHSIDADLAWDVSSGDENVVVAILDSGVRYFHVDLGGNSAQWGPASPFMDGNIFINAAETPGDGLDNDNNGFVDDTIGWDFVDGAGGGPVSCIDGDCDVPDSDPDDFNGHGTHLAGTVGAITNNGTIVSGIAGGIASGTLSSVANGCKILPLRIGFHARFQGLTTGVVRMDWAAEAMGYVANLVDAGVNVTAINCSWGSSNSGGLSAAVDALLARGVMVVHAAGNSNSSSPDFLGSKAGVMNVAATDRNGNGASFTNHGSWVDVAAPGVTILSTWREPSDPDPTHHYLAISDGTSMAAPQICGIAALLESCNPALTGADKFNLIINNTDPYTDARDLGTGIANARKALDATTCTCDLLAAFSAAPDSGAAPMTVNFSDVSMGAPIAWSWEFGDGSISMLQHPSHEYLADGLYTVKLFVANECGVDSLIQLDLVEVTATTTAVLPVDSGRGLESWASPNPFHTGTRIFLRLDREAPVELVVYDVAGRVVRNLLSRPFGPGLHSMPFDARDNGGTRLPSGIYFYRLVADGQVKTHKLILSR